MNNCFPNSASYGHIGISIGLRLRGFRVGAAINHVIARVIGICRSTRQGSAEDATRRCGGQEKEGCFHCPPFRTERANLHRGPLPLSSVDSKCDLQASVMHGCLQ